MKKLFYAVAVLLIVAAAFLLLRRNGDAATVGYRLVEVQQGDVESVVSSTGTLDAVTTVQVGTQVSGIVDRIYVDYNDPVQAGQVIARIDTTLLASSVAGAQAQLDRAQAELRYRESEARRIAALYKENLVSEAEYNESQYNVESAHASAKSARTDLARAERNLDYAIITAPIDGTVISRSVDVGQTVQSSFSSPELFLIAGDLTRMQILASVDESDVGRIQEGQTARFTVQAYPDDTFEGTVRQLRLQAVTEENVVNYTAVIDVANPDRKLLPGMTATVDFLVETARDVLYVANASLRYQPDQEKMAAAFERMRARREAQRNTDATPPTAPGGAPSRAAADDRGMLWSLDENGELIPIPVRTGISDGTNTVVEGLELAAGAQIIAGVSTHASTQSSTSNPFQQQNDDRRPGPPPPGGF